jgi:hypothetical protein
MPNDNIVWTKGGTGLRGNADASPNVPEYGTPQPVLDTASNKSYPDIQYPEKRGTHPFDQGTPDFMPNCGTVSEETVDVADQNDGRKHD